MQAFITHNSLDVPLGRCIASIALVTSLFIFPVSSYGQSEPRASLRQPPDPTEMTDQQILDSLKQHLNFPSNRKEDVLRVLREAGYPMVKPDPKAITEAEKIAALLKVFPLPAHNTHLIKRLMEVLKNGKTGRPTHIAQKRARFASSAGIIHHLTFDGGISLPKKEELQPELMTEKHLKLVRELVAEVTDRYRVSPEAESYVDQQSKQMKAQISPRTLPLCTASRTVRIRKPKSQESIVRLAQKTSNADMDLLFLPETAPDIRTFMSDIDELFGVNTRIHRYSTSPGDRLSLLADRGRAACLPFRIRTDAHHIYRYYGEKALRNYNAGKNKKGKLHPAIQRRLHAFIP